MNSTSVGDGSFDIGNDGVVGGSNSTIARDAYGYSLNYFSSDYKPIGQSVSGFKQPFINNTFDLTNSNSSLVARQLFNGNIAAMVVAIPKFNQINFTVPIANIYGYKYDQLNRIISMDVFTGIDNNTNLFAPSASLNYKERISYDPNGNIRTYQRNGSTLTGGLQTMDDLTYQYEKDATGNILSNKLRYVHDQVADGNYTEDINNQTTLTLLQVQNERSASVSSDNYQYDAIGNLIKDTKEAITNITWTVYGKIQSITKTTGAISYTYDASGNRISKLANGIETWYVRDASGNVMSVYTKDATINTGNLTQTEIHLYGSSRLGVLNTTTNVQNAVANTTGIYTFIRGNKFFELSNHLGNVLVTISDKKIGHDAGNGIIDYYTADVVTANDYYPGGMIMTGRKYAAGSMYRYGFNGKENDNEVKGEGNQQDYGMRIYDPRLGRFLSVDPLTSKFPHIAPYAAFNNNPLRFTDPTGMAPDDFVKDNKTGQIRWDDKANDQATTKAGETYLGKTLELKFNSYIDKKLWDGPNAKAPGDKLTTTVYVTGNENEKGELTSVSAGKHVVIGKTPYGTARDYYPGLGSDQNKFSLTATKEGGYSLNMEQHASVSKIEQLGMNAMGYNIVNVAQKLDVNISTQGKLSISTATDVFPSATLTVNGAWVMQYNQPSFVNTHTLPVKGSGSFNGNTYFPATPDYSYKPAVWYQR